MVRERFFICCGMQRGGTTWLSQQIRRHPDCDFPYRKELRYLDPLYYHSYEKVQLKRLAEFRQKMKNLAGPEKLPLSEKGAHQLRWWANYAFVSQGECNDAWYEALFDHCDPTKMTGDFSPDYSLLPLEGVAHLKRIAPHAKLIFMLRNPVDRLWSGATYAVRKRKDLSLDEKGQVAQKLMKRPLQNNFSDYPTIISNFEHHFPKEQILYLFHDDIATDPFDILRKVCDHLEISFDEAHFPRTDKSVNRSPTVSMPDEIRSEISARYMPKLEWLSERFGGHATTWLERARASVTG